MREPSGRGADQNGSGGGDVVDMPGPAAAATAEQELRGINCSSSSSSSIVLLAAPGDPSAATFEATRGCMSTVAACRCGVGRHREQLDTGACWPCPPAPATRALYLEIIDSRASQELVSLLYPSDTPVPLRHACAPPIESELLAGPGLGGRARACGRMNHNARDQYTIIIATQSAHCAARRS